MTFSAKPTSTSMYQRYVDAAELTGIKRRRQIGCPVYEVLEAILHLFNPHFSAFHA